MSITREQIVADLWNQTMNRALLEGQQRTRRSEAPTGSDGEETCRNCAALAESEATHRAMNQLLVAGPVPAQEAAALTHLVKRSALALAKGQNSVKLYIPKDAEKANVSKATMTRALNKLRGAADETLPFTVNDSWRGGKQRVAIAVPASIGDEDWSERRAYLALSRAQLAEERKKQGGSEEAVKARWSCRRHPDGAVVETTTKHYRCAEEDCPERYSPPSTVRRHPGANDPIQLESGESSGVVEIFGASFAPAATAHPHQVATVLPSIEEPHQVETGELHPVSFVTDGALGKPRSRWLTAQPSPEDELHDIDTTGTCRHCQEYTVFETRSGVTTCTSCSATLHISDLAPKPPPPEPKPLPIAPSSHIAGAFRRRRPPPSVMGAEE